MLQYDYITISFHKTIIILPNFGIIFPNRGVRQMLEVDSKGYEYRKWSGGITFPVSVALCDIESQCNKSFVCHWHDGIEIIAVTEGRIEHIVNGESYVMGAGDVMFVNSGSMHEGRAVDNGEGKYFALSFLVSLLSPEESGRVAEKYFGDTMSNGSIPHLYLPQGSAASEKIIEICTAICGYQHRREPCYELYIKSELFRLWAILCKEASRVGVERKPDASVERVKTAVEYIEENYRNKISLEDISAACKISKSELYRSFKRVMKRTPIDYVVDFRMRRSMLLLDKGASVTEAAMSSGFFDSSYYTKMFKRYVGCTPREYLRK